MSAPDSFVSFDVLSTFVDEQQAETARIREKLQAMVNVMSGGEPSLVEHALREDLDVQLRLGITLGRDQVLAALRDHLLAISVAREAGELRP